RVIPAMSFTPRVSGVPAPIATVPGTNHRVPANGIRVEEETP
ncbi:MAG: hypothetical protein QOE53_588, partial [Pseudonocardiales bacterium]|nr:hypothetical protein [Pseudonocardiales bacterium]